MKKITSLISSILLLSSISFAQDYCNRAVFTTGGTFQAPGNHVKLYSVGQNLQDTTAIDSFLGDFANDLVIDGVLAYLHVGKASGKDLIVKYNIAQKAVVDTVSYGGVQKFAHTDEYLFMTLGFGASSSKRLVALDKSDFSEVYADTTLSSPSGMALIDETLYVASEGLNTGLFSAYDVSGQIQKLHTFDPADTLTIGMGNVARYGDKVFAFNSRYDNNFNLLYTGTVVLNTADSSITADTTVTGNGIAGVVKDSLFYFNSSGIQAFYNNSLSHTSIAGGSGLTAAAYDTVSNSSYSYSTDYFSYGALTARNQNWVSEQTVQTDISGAALKVLYNKAPWNVQVTEISNGYEVSFDSEPGDSAQITSASFVDGIHSASINGNEVTVTKNSTETDTLMIEVCDAFGCCTTIYEEVSGSVGFNEKGLNHEIAVYPNPAENSLRVENLTPGSAYEIYDVRGLLVQEGRYEGRIFVESLQSGFYVLKTNETTIKWLKK
ncbi:T9SS type A sorting domain-containing protein [Salibacter halophilus]|uniref:T9SS type A sorting domain-containing protein n=1 Tax=Salibacter halophilus TaxID=1803916 RepID=A0A6N6M8S3_9FLAO|nr:T9SS type A sorting domain-containing protein [Salibacter halophilus]KAB1065164.1 T9SS type A sorting domain-containing protein [Salibacter halophilus]